MDSQRSAPHRHVDRMTLSQPATKKAMITEITGTCAWEGCDKPATHIAAGGSGGWTAIKGHEKPACYCKPHAESVQAEGISEYHIKCPNCRCMFQC